MVTLTFGETSFRNDFFDLIIGNFSHRITHILKSKFKGVFVNFFKIKLSINPLLGFFLESLIAY